MQRWVYPLEIREESEVFNQVSDDVEYRLDYILLFESRRGREEQWYCENTMGLVEICI